MKKRLAWLFVAFVLGPVLLYLLSYAGLRATKVIVRRQWIQKRWSLPAGVSATVIHNEMQCGHPDGWLATLYGPLGRLELRVRGYPPHDD
ncbi:MAG: hypothetical protein AAF581_11630 [Planctomycetota bacterium]